VPHHPAFNWESQGGGLGRRGIPPAHRGVCPGNRWHHIPGFKRRGSNSSRNIKPVMLAVTNLCFCMHHKSGRKAGKEVGQPAASRGAAASRADARPAGARSHTPCRRARTRHLPRGLRACAPAGVGGSRDSRRGGSGAGRAAPRKVWASAGTKRLLAPRVTIPPRRPPTPAPPRRADLLHGHHGQLLPSLALAPLLVQLPAGNGRALGG
jgi:hypothetical protein